MKIGDYLRTLNNEELSSFFVIFMLITIKSVDVEVGGLDIDMEREELYKLLEAPVTDELKESIYFYLGKNKFAS